MAKARRKSKAAAKRPARKAKRGRKAAAKRKPRKTAKPKAARGKARQEGPVAGAVHAVVDTIQETADLRNKLGGRHTFED